jgi:hypothetical protein
VVDENDLDDGQRRHLRECPVCREELRRLEGGLYRLGRAAAKYTPESVGRSALPVAEREPPHRPAFGWRIAWGTAFSLALVMLIAVWAVFRGSLPPLSYQDVAQEMAEDEMLLAEVFELEENPLPDAYREISPEETAGIDEEIFDFIVPVEGWSTDQESGTKEV